MAANTPTKSIWLTGSLCILACTSACANTTHLKDRSEYRAPYASSAPSVDGVADEAIWNQAGWRELDQRWLGPEYTSDDFSGRFKVVWTEKKLYLLAEITDDILIDTHRNPLTQYWDDDCIEIFLDENYSGGNHQYNHNAFAYHVSLDNQTVDIGSDEKPRNYSRHIDSSWKQHGDTIIWELAISIYNDAYTDGSDNNVPVTLTPGKILGLMVAYCDNDGSEVRENFIGSEAVLEGSASRGWIDADIFGKLILDK
ncbi:MAG: CBM9 family sugar-binding protein [Gammaproteobacteria bacterium]